MACKLPVLSKCCCCVPLRPGLLVWGYLRLVSAVAFLLLILHVVRVRFSAEDLAILLALLSFLVANVVFSCLFVIGAHKKNPNLMQVYYSFSIFHLVLGIVCFLSILGLEAYLWVHHGQFWYMRDLASNVVVNVSAVVDILLQIYFIALVRSEILKLKSQRVQFANFLEEEPRVVLDMPITKEQDQMGATLTSDSEDEIMARKPLFPLKELERLRRDVC